jgi:hypothetical protein
MATSLQPSSSISQSNNIASLANANTLSTLQSSNLPSTFGSQVKSAAKSKIKKSISQSTIVRLEKEKANLILEGIKLEKDHRTKLQQIEQKHTPTQQIINGETVTNPPEYDDTQYNDAIIIENGGTLSTGQIVEGNYPTAKKVLQAQKDKNQKDIDNYTKDPLKKHKENKKKRKEERDKVQKRTKEEKVKARRARTKSVLSNAKKTITPILTLVLTNKLTEIVSNNDIIKQLVDDTNAIIIAANESNDPTKLNNAKLVRDNAITVIQKNENKIILLNKELQKIQLYITIFSTIVTIISSIQIPTAPVPITTAIIIKFIKILDKANRIVLSLSALIPILLSSLESAIAILEDYKAQLLDINGQLDTAALTTNPSLLGDNQYGTDYGTYKGFRFALREDNDPRFNVRGNKRHYAEAIDTNNVAVLKSEYSFTLDPNDLIESLKLIIDSQNLIA